MGGLHGIGCSQVVVLSGVDDHSCKSVDDPREELVYEGPLHVDVPEEDTVEGVVEHHVESLERAHDGYLGHAQAGTVVAQADIAADLLAHLVQGLAHDAEVLLGSIGAAEPFGSGSVRHIVQQGLAGGTDDRDDVGALTCGGLGLHHILVDVAGGHYHIEVGLGALADLAQVFLAAGAAGPNPLHRGIYRLFESLLYLR